MKLLTLNSQKKHEKNTYERVIPYFKSTILPELFENKNVLIVAHGKSLRLLVMFLEKLSPAEIVTREIGTCVPLNYEFSKQKMRNLISA